MVLLQWQMRQECIKLSKLVLVQFLMAWWCFQNELIFRWLMKLRTKYDLGLQKNCGCSIKGAPVENGAVISVPEYGCISYNCLYFQVDKYFIYLQPSLIFFNILIFRLPAGICRVAVIQARNLKDTDMIGKSDPYCVVKVGSLERKVSLLF